MSVPAPSTSSEADLPWWWERTRLQNGVARLIGAFYQGIERHGGLCLLLLAMVYLSLALVEARVHPLTSDEIYTWHIAQAPSVRGMLLLAREIDLHPPLHYLLQREALHLPLPRWFDSRLPSLLAGLVATLALFRLTARRLGNTLATGAVAVLWFSPALRYAWENRPYMLLLCLLTLLIGAWQRATEPVRTWRSVAAVFLASLLMVGDHLIGIACLVPFALAEADRLRQRRIADWALWAALFTPVLLGAGFFYQVHHMQQNSFPAVHLASVDGVVETYNELTDDLIFGLLMCIVALSFLPHPAEPPRPRESRLGQGEAVLLASICLLPVMVGLAGAVLHLQVWRRYGFAAAIGFALLLPVLIERKARAPKALSALLLLASLGFVVQQMTEAVDPAEHNAGLHQTGRRSLRFASLDSRLPIVAASPMTFTEMSDREPFAIASRTFYLTDRAAALRYSGYTLFENEAKIRELLQLPSQTAPLTDFLAAHPAFYLVATYKSADDWLPRALADRGLDLNYLGKVASTYQDDDLYLVSAGTAPGSL